MKTKIVVTIALMIAIIMYALPSFAQQDKCGCIKDIKKNQVTVPYCKDGVTIQFYYLGEFMSQVVYENWNDIAVDFTCPSKDVAVINFDWNWLGKFGKHNNWETIVNNVDGKTYIGNWLDMSMNHDAEKIRINDIQSSCFNPSCSPETEVVTLKVYLANK